MPSQQFSQQERWITRFSDGACEAVFGRISRNPPIGDKLSRNHGTLFSIQPNRSNLPHQCGKLSGIRRIRYKSPVVFARESTIRHALPCQIGYAGINPRVTDCRKMKMTSAGIDANPYARHASQTTPPADSVRQPVSAPNLCRRHAAGYRSNPCSPSTAWRHSCRRSAQRTAQNSHSEPPHDRASGTTPTSGRHRPTPLTHQR